MNLRRAFIALCIFAVVVAGYVAFYYWDRYANTTHLNKPKVFGVTFSAQYAESLNLNWREAYLAILEDLNVNVVRVPVYWNVIEPTDGSFYLDDVQWMLDQAAIHDANVILAVGYRAPRWPECHIPDWLADSSEETIHQQELSMLRQLVTQFSQHPALYRWQVENEPFVNFFGECEKSNPEYINDSIAYVQSLDKDTPVMTTDSGELSSWFAASEQADELGISVYRTAHSPLFGFFKYPLSPSFYSIKMGMVKPRLDNIIIAELQAEPWAGDALINITVDEQFTTMNPEIFNDNIDYVKRVDTSMVLLWGAEWWYYLKVNQQNDAMWEAARPVFSASAQLPQQTLDPSELVQ